MAKKIGINLLNYSHNRDNHYKLTGGELLNLLDQFADQDELDTLFEYYNDRYSLPKDVVKRRFKQNLAKSYRYKAAKFSEILKIKSTFVSIIKYWGLLIAVLVYSKQVIKKKKYKLIIDDLFTPIELDRFSKLINLFGSENVLCLTANDFMRNQFPDHNIQKKTFIKNFSRAEVLKVLYNEISKGFITVLKVSIKNRINLFPTIMLILKDYLCYKSLFQAYSGDYMIQERHYFTNAIKNFLFKKMGGIASATIQKNLLILDHTIYYIDADCFFSLGNRTAERAFEYGSNIKNVIPSGSLFLEHWLRKRPLSVVDKKYDVVMIGINVTHAYNRMDSYTKFIDDYYDSIRWLVRFKKEYPQYEIVIKHHTNTSRDEIEAELIFGCGIEVLVQENSYDVAFESRSAVTFGSTMGYELNAHGVPAFFFDPGHRCSVLPDQENDAINGLRMASYDDLKDKLLGVLIVGDEEIKPSFKPDDICIRSESVSNKIYEAFVC